VRSNRKRLSGASSSSSSSRKITCCLDILCDWCKRRDFDIPPCTLALERDHLGVVHEWSTIAATTIGLLNISAHAENVLMKSTINEVRS
jgi:hypothetical protein